MPRALALTSKNGGAEGTRHECALLLFLGLSSQALYWELRNARNAQGDACSFTATASTHTLHSILGIGQIDSIVSGVLTASLHC